MRILYINTLYYPDEVGGAERSVRLLAEAMVSQGHEAAVLSLGEKDAESQKNGVALIYSKIKNIYHPFKGGGEKKALHKLAWHAIDSFNVASMAVVHKVINDFSPDLIHTNNVSGFSVSVWQVAKSRHIPIVHTLRDYYLLCPRASMFKEGASCGASRCLDCRILSMPRSLASAKVDTVVGNSAYILAEHVKRGYFPRAKRSVIFNAYESQVKPVDVAERPDSPIFGYIGRLDETKGIEYLIQSFSQAFGGSVDGNSSAELLIAGQGPEEYVNHLKSLASDLNIKFLGRVDPAYFYRRIHYTVLPALWAEPLARVIFESFVHGVPLVATATGGTPELVVDSVTGFLVKPGDVPEMVQALRRAPIKGDDYLSMVRECEGKTPHFKYERVAASYLEVYLNAIR